MMICEVTYVKLILYIKLTRFAHFRWASTLMLVFSSVQYKFSSVYMQLKSKVLYDRWEELVFAHFCAFLFRNDQLQGKYLHTNAG